MAGLRARASPRLRPSRPPESCTSFQERDERGCPPQLPGGGTRLGKVWAAGPAAARCVPTSAGDSRPYGSPQHAPFSARHSSST